MRTHPNISATLRGGLRSGNHKVEVTPVTVYIPAAGQYHVASTGQQALDALAAKRAAAGENAPGNAPTALGAILAAVAARKAAQVKPARKPRRKSAGAMATSPRSAQSRENDRMYRRARRALEKYAAAQACKVGTARLGNIKQVYITDMYGAQILHREKDSIYEAMRCLCLTLKLEV